MIISVATHKFFGKDRKCKCILCISWSWCPSNVLNDFSFVESFVLQPLYLPIPSFHVSVQNFWKTWLLQSEVPGLYVRKSRMGRISKLKQAHWFVIEGQWWLVQNLFWRSTFKKCLNLFLRKTRVYTFSYAGIHQSKGEICPHRKSRK